MFNDKIYAANPGIYKADEYMMSYGDYASIYNRRDMYADQGTVKTIAVCGSMKFTKEMKEQEIKLTKMGCTVLMPIMDFEEPQKATEAELVLYRDAHRNKIKMSDAIMVINKDGYVGRHTAGEIEYASKFGKYIYFLEDESQQFGQV